MGGGLVGAGRDVVLAAEPMAEAPEFDLTPGPQRGVAKAHTFELYEVACDVVEDSLGPLHGIRLGAHRVVVEHVLAGAEHGHRPCSASGPAEGHGAGCRWWRR